MEDRNNITYEDLEKAIEGFDYIHVPKDYHDDPWKYPEIGFDIEGGTTLWKLNLN